MKKFSLEEFKKNPNRKVVTRSGLPVRIVCTDKKGDYPVVALVENSDNTEDVHSFRENGLFCERYKINADLFFDSVKKRGWVNLYRTEKGMIIFGNVRDTKEDALDELKDAANICKYIDTIHIEWEE